MRKIKGQERMLELIAALVFISFLLLVLQFFIAKYYAHKIEMLYHQTSYEKAIKVYKAIAGDQLFSLSSMETGYLDETKLSAILLISKNEDKVCDFISSFFGSSVYLNITNLEAYSSTPCTYQHPINCSIWEFCKRNKRKVKTYYDLYISLYDPLTEKTYIGYVKIGV